MDKRKLAIAIIALVVIFGAVLGYNSTRMNEDPQAEAEAAREEEEVVQEACASDSTYARLKELAFDQAVRIRNSDPENLDILAANAVVRMENPVVKSRDEDLNTTVCSGRFVLELPPGAERGFGGQRRLVADIEYAAQTAADGSGLVYQMSGAEPIIYRLAAFDLQGQHLRPPTPIEMADAGNAVSEVPEFVEEESSPAMAERPDPAPSPSPEPPEPRAPEPAPQPRAETSNPSFNCRNARTRSEKMVCASNRLAAKDRAMSSLFYSALSDADPRSRRLLRQTRDKFLAYRDRCGSEACVAQAYDGRMEEIRDIMSGDY